MTVLEVVFLFAALVTLASAGMVVSVRRMMHAAFWLVLALMGGAVLMALLETRFFAMIQLMVYIGAIAILIIIGVMLTRRMMDDQEPQHIHWWPAAAASGAVLLAGLITVMSTWSGFWTSTRTVPSGGENIEQFGQALVSPTGFVVPFEIASVLLVAAMVGAIYIAIERKGSAR